MDRIDAPARQLEIEARFQARLVTLEAIEIKVGRESDGRFWADIECMPGVVAYGSTREAAITAALALALRIAAECIDRGEDVPEAFIKLSPHQEIKAFKVIGLGNQRSWTATVQPRTELNVGCLSSADCAAGL